MKQLSIRNLFWAIGLLMTLPLVAQVSHGGHPLPLSALRSAESDWLVEMPAFDLAEQLRIDSLEATDLRNGFRFAYKFLTDYRPDNVGRWFTLPDGTRVWRFGIRSRGACSLNLLFTEYELPEGAQLFLYNADQTQVLGAFNHLNNSEKAILPTALIEGESLIVEYQEPAQAAFHGRLAIGEVNHGYRSLQSGEPGSPWSSLSCIPSPLCYADSLGVGNPIQRSVVLLVINGNLFCTGSLVNNSAQDGTPYLLTASHCLNDNFRLENPDYAEVAGTIVTFFQYESPLCNPTLMGTKELSMASAQFCAANEEHDLILLKLNELPPIHYRPYLAGWDRTRIDQGPYQCIQHPQGGPKGLAFELDTISYQTFEITEYPFAAEAHLLVPHWEVGCTAGGSSGSPLFDRHQRLIGALTGGHSSCSSPTNDYFYAISQVWDLGEPADRQLQDWLDPAHRSERCDGLDPYAEAPCQRLSHVQESGQIDQVEVTCDADKLPLFGNRESQEYAEAYLSKGPGLLYGAYVVTPNLGSQYPKLQVTIQVYAGPERPTELLYSQPFQPAYQSYVKGTFQENPKSLYAAQESFVAFDQPIPVEGDFFISYRIDAAPEELPFAVYQLPKGVATRNTAWVRQAEEWIEATDYQPAGFATSFYIDPVWQYRSSVANEPVEAPSPIQLIQDRSGQRIQIRLPQEATDAELTLVTLNGQVKWRQPLPAGDSWISTHALPTGLYLVEIRYDRTRWRQKIHL